MSRKKELQKQLEWSIVGNHISGRKMGFARINGNVLR